VTGPLAGRVVVVTRPARQSGRFTDSVRADGAQTVAFPTLVVEPLPLEPGAAQTLTGKAFDWIVYTSANAVEHCPAGAGRPGAPRVAAIGRATARALEEAGVRVDVVPEAGADSEALLAHPAFAGVRGARVLIVKGAGGRDALRAGLASRGALVSTAEVYRRIRTTPTQDALAELETAPRRGTVVVAVTSVEVLEALLALAPVPRFAWLRDAPLLLPGTRVAAAAQRLGWRGPLVVSGSAEDATMADALVRWARADDDTGDGGPPGSA
jgi:uroporphyrinogen-III synthase